MKANIQGIEVDGTPEEIAKLIKEIGVIKPEIKYIFPETGKWPDYHGYPPYQLPNTVITQPYNPNYVTCATTACTAVSGSKDIQAYN